MPHPKSGRMTRSPRDLSRMMRMDCAIHSSYRATLMRLSSSSPTGKPQPTPRNSPGIYPVSSIEMRIGNLHSIQLDHRSFHIHQRIGGNVHVGLRLALHGCVGTDLDSRSEERRVG